MPCHFGFLQEQNTVVPDFVNSKLKPTPRLLHPMSWGRRGRKVVGCKGDHSWLPCLPSWERFATSSRQSEGNQPTRPLTWPSQKPPSPMLSTGWDSGDKGQGNVLSFLPFFFFFLLSPFDLPPQPHYIFGTSSHVFRTASNSLYSDCDLDLILLPWPPQC